MDTREYFIELYDIYRNLFTIKQRFYFEKYYFEDLSMQEISVLSGVSKSYISKETVKIQNKLIEYESLLKCDYYNKSIRNIIRDSSNIKKDLKSLLRMED
ncbi:MAG: DNA-binding protein [Bacilli bacterium]